MEKGTIEEEGSPNDLLSKKTGKFYQMANSAGLVSSTDQLGSKNVHELQPVYELARL